MVLVLEQEDDEFLSMSTLWPLSDVSDMGSCTLLEEDTPKIQGNCNLDPEEHKNNRCIEVVLMQFTLLDLF